MLYNYVCRGDRGQLYRGASFYRGGLRNHSTHVEIPSTIVGWKSTSRHNVQKSGVKKTKLTRCEKKRLFNHLKLVTFRE